MAEIKNIDWKTLDAIIFDFDGVLTNNKVYLNQDGSELVACHRGDGLAFDVFRKLDICVYILSTEKNPVVSARAKKLGIPVLQGIKNKKNTLIELAKKDGIDISRVMYVGNDLNDFHVMGICGLSACPVDSHASIKELATITLKTKGGCGVVRELVENVLNINIVDVLYT